MKDFIGRTIFERDWITYTVRNGCHHGLKLATVLDVERDRVRVEPPNGKPVWLRTPAHIAILDEPQEWELA